MPAEDANAKRGGGAMELELCTAIEVDRTVLIETLGTVGTKKDSAAWAECCASLVMVVNYVYHKVQEHGRLGVHELRLRQVKGETARAERCRAACLRSLVATATSAKYKPVAEPVFEYGTNVLNYSSGLHADMGMDLRKPHPLLERVLSHHPLSSQLPAGSKLPLYCNRCLLYTTGYATSSKRGQFLFGKANGVLDIGLRQMKQYLFSVGLLDEPKIKQQSVIKTSSTPDVSSSVFQSKTATTRTVKDAIEESWLNLFREIEVREVVFEKLIVMYPTDSHVSEKKTVVSLFKSMQQAARKDDAQEGKSDTHEVDEVPSSLKVMIYNTVPLRDLGLVLPDRLVSTTNVDNLSFVVEFVLILLLLNQVVDKVSALQFSDLSAILAGENSAAVLLLTLIPTCVYRLVMLCLNFVWAVDYYRSAVRHYVATKLSSSGNAAVTELYEDVKDQEVKVVILAYWLLWQRGEVTPSELDASAEVLMKEEFGVEVDFDVDHALQRLELLGMAAPVPGTPLWKAIVSPKEFVSQPIVPWSSYLQFALAKENPSVGSQ